MGDGLAAHVCPRRLSHDLLDHGDHFMSHSESSGEPVDTSREDLLQMTRADPNLTPQERETTVGFAVDEERARVYTEEAALIRRLLSHRAVSIDGLGIHSEGVTRSHPLEEALRVVGPGDLVVQLRGRMPLGYLSIKSESRANNRHAAVVSEEVLR